MPYDNDTEYKNTESEGDNNAEENSNVTDEHVEDKCNGSKHIKRKQKVSFTSRFSVPLEKPVTKIATMNNKTKDICVYSLYTVT